MDHRLSYGGIGIVPAPELPLDTYVCVSPREAAIRRVIDAQNRHQFDSRELAALARIAEALGHRDTANTLLALRLFRRAAERRVVMHSSLTRR